MKNNIKYFLAAVICYLITGCTNRNRVDYLTADFQIGKITISHKSKLQDTAAELTLRTLFYINKKGMNAELSNYFQYQLGKKIKLVIGGDTMAPVLFYYLPLVNEAEKEIDVKYLIGKPATEKTKLVIIDDTILDFNKINISFK